MKYLPIPKLTDSDLQRFWDKVDIAGPDDCWEWTGARCQGYGKFGIGQTLYKSSRLSYAIENGDPGNFNICHSCDNPPCVNPAHLWVGTQQDNMNDCIVKNRLANPEETRHIGEENGRTSLTEDDIITIRASDKSRKILAEHFDVDPATISEIQLGNSWQHVGETLRTRLDGNRGSRVNVRGVTFCKQTGRYKARFMLKGHEYNLGRFDTISEASEVLTRKKLEVGV